MINKYGAIFVLILLLMTYVVPAMGECTTQPTDTTKVTSYESLHDAAFNQQISLFMRLAGFSSMAACVIKDDQIIWSNGYGYYDRVEQKPTTTETIYVLASITKTIVGTALMQLYDQGLFSLDDDVNTFLPFDLRNPNFPDDPITFRMLLSHTSSLNTNNQAQYYMINFSGDPPFDFSPEPFLREFLVPGGRYYDSSVWSTEYRPGAYAMYANVGFDLIAYLVEIISGKPFLEYCDAHIFIPLEMKNTGFNFSRFDIDRVAIPYQRFNGRFYTINQLAFLLGDDWTPPGLYYRVRFYAAGGLYSTVSDLSHFLIAHMNEGLYNGTRILQKETVALMHELQPGNRIGYGLAWMRQYVRGLWTSGHGGDLPGGDTWMLYNQTEDIGVIYFANGNPGYSMLPLGGLIPVRLILGALFTKEGTLNEDTARSSSYYQTSFVMTPWYVHSLLSCGQNDV